MKKAQALALGNPPAAKPMGEVLKSKMAAVGLDSSHFFAVKAGSAGSP
jgi:hypothetical protein